MAWGNKGIYHALKGFVIARKPESSGKERKLKAFFPLSSISLKWKDSLMCFSSSEKRHWGRPDGNVKEGIRRIGTSFQRQWGLMIFK